MFRVGWYYRNDPEKIFYGEYQESRSVAQAWVDKMNYAYPDMFHFIEKLGA